jgi:PHD/YefM family antitoxin component YafN of YafNO toxin-antitoxin module
MKQYSMTRARNKLSALVRDLDAHDPIQPTQYGNPVAIWVSLRAYQRLSGERRDFWNAYQAFRQPHSLEQLNIEPDVFNDVRQTSPGRAVHF